MKIGGGKLLIQGTMLVELLDHQDGGAGVLATPCRRGSAMDVKASFRSCWRHDGFASRSLVASRRMAPTSSSYLSTND